MADTAVNRRFPRWRLFNRTVFMTEQLLGTLPMVLATPVVAALFGTTLAVSQPSEVVRHDVVVGPSIATSFLLALAGAVGGVFIVTLGAFCTFLLRYRLRGDPVWAVTVFQERERIKSLLAPSSARPLKGSRTGHLFRP